jgi:hypothetical protein
MEYSITDGSLSLESANKNNVMQYVFRFSQKYINQTLSFNLIASISGNKFNDGGFLRTWLDYNYDDNIKLTAGIIDYIGGENKMFDLFKDNDKIFYNIQYSF